MARRKNAKLVAISDTHVPDENSKAVAWACERIAAHKPDYVAFLGDLFEADAGSRFYNEKKHDLRDELRAGARVLDSLGKAWPGASRVWCLGNHDAHLTSPGRIDRRLRTSIHWNASEWKDSYLAWRQIPYDFSAAGCIQLGQVLLWHGHDGSEEYNALKIVNATGGFAHRLVIGGHTHTPHGPTQLMRTKSITLPTWTANTGTLGPLRPDWTQRQDTSRWAPALAVVEFKLGRACQPGRNWSCELETMH